MGYLQLGLALGIAGVGISMCFPTVANAVMGSVPTPRSGSRVRHEQMLRELGGVLGIAVLASVFARPGVYQSPRVFIDGFTDALWVGGGLSAVGVVAALLVPGRKRTVETSAAPAALATHAAIAETT